MGFYKALFVIVILILIQSSFVTLIQVKEITPDVVLVFMVSWCAQKKRYQGVLLGFMGGLAQDLMEGGLLGVFALSRSIACYLSCSFPWRYYHQNTIIFGIIIFIASLVHQIIYLLIVSRNAAGGYLKLFLRYGIPAVFYTVLFSILIRSIIGLLEKKNDKGYL